jgi:hypothetical protein
MLQLSYARPDNGLLEAEICTSNWVCTIQV